MKEFKIVVLKEKKKREISFVGRGIIVYDFFCYFLIKYLNINILYF